jgi:hypothetical protein
MLRTQLLATLVGVAAFHASIGRAHYTLTDDYTGQNFFEKMDFFNESDPTHGAVAYQNLGSAIDTGLAGFVPAAGVSPATGSANPQSNSSNVFLGVDFKSKAAMRPSTRVTSKSSYQHGLLIADIAHAPVGQCGLWPALWMVGENWPNNGEIDIMEGVNMYTTNQVTLHTNTGCVADNSSAAFQGTLMTKDCDVNSATQDKNVGCGIAMPASSPTFNSGNLTARGLPRSRISRAISQQQDAATQGASFGRNFNAQGGGVWAMEWTSQGIKVWFFPYSNSPSFDSTKAFPSSLLSDSPVPDQFGKPAAAFTGAGCNWDSHFKNQSIVINTSLCGDWAGKVWEQDQGGQGSCAKITGAKTCEEYVQNNPAAFQEAYWEIRSLKYYQSEDEDR